MPLQASHVTQGATSLVAIPRRGKDMPVLLFGATKRVEGNEGGTAPGR